MTNYLTLKRFFDLFFSIIFIFFLSPLILIFLFIVYVKDFKNPIFIGIRVGKEGKLFKIFKIRSMKVGSEIGSKTTAKNDTRLTTIGKFIRFIKIDELPQLFNILIGDMSFVGPRPEIKDYVDLYDEKELISLNVRPGITDYSSIKFVSLFNKVGEESAHDYYKKYVFKEKNRLRIKYVKDISFFTDLKILFLTFFVLIFRVIKN